MLIALLYHFIASSSNTDSKPVSIWYWCSDPEKLSDPELIWFQTYLIPNLFDSEPSLILNQPDLEPIWFWTDLTPTNLIPNQSDSKPIWFRTNLILNPSGTGYNMFLFICSYHLARREDWVLLFSWMVFSWLPTVFFYLMSFCFNFLISFCSQVNLRLRYKQNDAKFCFRFASFCFEAK